MPRRRYIRFDVNLNANFAQSTKDRFRKKAGELFESLPEELRSKLYFDPDHYYVTYVPGHKCISVGSGIDQGYESNPAEHLDIVERVVELISPYANVDFYDPVLEQGVEMKKGDLLEYTRLQRRSRHILALIYEREYIFFVEVVNFSSEKMEVSGSFVVPVSPEIQYTREPLSYVASIERHMCVNQLAYVLVGLLVQSGQGEFEKVSPEAFTDAETGFRMWSVREQFEHRSILPKDQPFELTMRVPCARVNPTSLSIVDVEFDGAIRGSVRFAARIDRNIKRHDNEEAKER